MTKDGIRRASFSERLKYLLGIRKFAGGLWHSNSFKNGNQELVLLNQLYKLKLTVSDSTTNLTLIKYPRLTKDPEYLYEKLEPILFRAISFEKFSEAYYKTVKSNLVNKYNEQDD